MSTTTGTSLPDMDVGHPEQTQGGGGAEENRRSMASPRPDSLSLDGWCVVSEIALTKEMLQHLSKPEEIASLAASYLTRQLFSLLENGLDPALVDNIFKALQEVSEHDEIICRNFIAELNEELELEELPSHLPSNDNGNNGKAEQRRCPRSVIKVMLDLLRFSPIPVEHNILWIRLLCLLSHSPQDLPTLIDLKVAATVLGTMAVHVRSAEIQRSGCGVLEPLAKFRPTPSQKAPVRESGIQVLLRTLEAHSSDSSVVLAVCMVLADLACTMSQFTSWAIQQDYGDDEAEKLVVMALSITDYIKENGLPLLDQVGTMHLDHAEIQTEFYRIMACFGYHCPASSVDEAHHSSDQRKHSILKGPESLTCPKRRVTFSYDLDTRVEYQCSDSDSDFGAEEPKRHTVCGGERVSGRDCEGEAVFLDSERKNRLFKGRMIKREDKKLSFPNFEMEEDYLQMWQHILGEGLFSSICCDLAKLERDFDEMGSGSLKSSSSSSETVDLLDYGCPVDISHHPFVKQPLDGPSKSLPARCEMRLGRDTTRFATIPAYRYDFYHPDWQVQDTDEVVRNRLSAEIDLGPRQTKVRPKSEPPPQTYFDQNQQEHKDENRDSEGEDSDPADDKACAEYSEIDLVEALVRSNRKDPESALPMDDVLHDDEKVEMENKGNEEKEHCRERSASEKTITGVITEEDTSEEKPEHCLDPNSNGIHADPFCLETDLFPIDKYLEHRSLADDILNSFGIYENTMSSTASLEPVVSGPYGSFTLSGASNGCSETDDVFLEGDSTVSDCYSKRKLVRCGNALDTDYERDVVSAEEATKHAFAKVFESLREPSDIFHPSLTSSPTSSISSASLSLAEWSDLEALNEEEESVASMDTVTTQDTPPNSEAEMSNSHPSHTIPKQRKINFMHRFSERKTQNYPPPPKPRRTWYYRSSADVRKSLVSSFPLEAQSALGMDSHTAKLGRSLSRNGKRGLSLLAFGKSSTSMSCDSGVSCDDECPSGTNQETYPDDHFYEEVYMSKAELKPTLYERISRKGHYAEVKKASKVQVPEDNSSEATYAVCTLWVNKHCVEALVTFDHLTKQLVSPYSIVPAVRQLEGTRKSSLGANLDEVENDYPAWTSILNVLATEESKWTLSLAAQVLPIIDRLFYTKDEAIMDASVGLVQLLIRKFGHEIEKHHSGGLFRTRFRDDCRTCYLWLNKLYSRVSDLLKRESRSEEDLDSLLHLSLLSSLWDSLKPFNGRISRGMAL